MVFQERLRTGLGQTIETSDKKVNELHEKEQGVKPVAEPTDIQKFALVNFKKIYQDGKFVILSVPGNLTPPSSLGDNAMILSGTEGMSTDPNNPSVMVTLPYTSKFYNRIGDSEFAKVSKDKENLLLYT